MLTQADKSFGAEVASVITAGLGFSFAKRCWFMLAIFPVTAFLVCGCHKKNAGVSTPPATADATVNAVNHEPSTAAASFVPTGPVRAVLPTSAVLQDPSVRANLKALNARLHQYLAEVHEMPRSFDTFAAATQIEVPMPPAGMRYVIYNASVTLGPQ